MSRLEFGGKVGAQTLADFERNCLDLIRFADPLWLLCLGFAALPWIRRRRPRLVWPTLGGFRSPGSGSGLVWFGWLSPMTRSLALICLVVGLARPQSAGEQIRIYGRGVAIALVVDRSSSMKTADFPDPSGGPAISRLDAARATLERFLEARDEDLIGVVTFANLPETTAPPTLDRAFVWDAIQAIRPAGAGDDGTDLGGAIAWGLDLIRLAPTQRKVLILLTDGRHAPGSSEALAPTVAAEVARGLGITLHTVAIGRPTDPVRLAIDPPAPVGPPSPTPTVVGSSADGPDLELLRILADRGHGRAFVAIDTSSLDAIFGEIDALETSPIQGTIQTVYRERFAPWVGGSLVLIAADLLLSSGRLRRIP